MCVCVRMYVGMCVMWCALDTRRDHKHKKMSGFFVVFRFFHLDVISHRNDNMLVRNTVAHSSLLPVSRERPSILSGQSFTEQTELIQGKSFLKAIFGL